MKFEVEMAMQNLEALVDVLHTACSGDDHISTETMIGFTNVMSDVHMDLKSALESE